MADEGSKPAPSGVSGYISTLLGYIDTPWKAGVVAGLAILGFVGWIFYGHQDEIIESWMTPSETSLKVGDVPEALEKLTQETSADLVQVWSVNLPSNSQRFIGARRHDGQRPVIPEPRRLPIIVHASDIKVILEVLNGAPSCLDTTANGTPFSARLAERGYTRGCAVPIPPGPSSFVGVVYLSWITVPPKDEEVVAVAAAGEIAVKLVNR